MSQIGVFTDSDHNVNTDPNKKSWGNNYLTTKSNIRLVSFNINSFPRSNKNNKNEALHKFLKIGFGAMYPQPIEFMREQKIGLKP
jgi:hypothetical protein